MKYFFSILFLLTCSSFSFGQLAEFTSNGPNVFGEDITNADAVTIDDVIDQVSAEDTLQVTLSGHITEVCQAKGCWMSLESESGEHSIFIKFKDYGFFVPLESGGMKAQVRGDLYASVTPVSELRHYAEDKGASKEEIAAITEPQTELKMMADGVVIYRD
ncbi:MAG: DUF4920 domain-containing protein [Bacteroidota bacterium]